MYEFMPTGEVNEIQYFRVLYGTMKAQKVQNEVDF